MKQAARTAGGGRWKLPTEDEVEVLEALLNLRKLIKKSELISRYSFNWGRKKIRSAVGSKSEAVPSTSPENVAAKEASKSPTTPLCFLPDGGSGSDGGDGNRKPPASDRKVIKRKATDDLLEIYNKKQQENEILMKKLKAVKTLHQELTSENLELKARGQKINYPKNMEDFRIWNSSMKVIDQQRCHQQITMFGPPTLQQPQYCHQRLVVDPNNGKLVAVSCSSNSNGGGRFGLFNQIDPRVKIHGEAYDFMAASQPLDQSKYVVMDNEYLRVRNAAAAAAAARQRRILRRKENKNSLVAMKLSRACR